MIGGVALSWRARSPSEEAGLTPRPASTLPILLRTSRYIAGVNTIIWNLLSVSSIPWGPVHVDDLVRGKQEQGPRITTHLDGIASGTAQYIDT